MERIKQQQLIGNWIEGYALNIHTLSSIPKGENEYGNMTFKTNRTEIGQLLYELKYNQNSSNVNELVQLSTDFIRSQWSIADINAIIPAPWSKERKIQPVYLIAQMIASNLDICYCDYFKKIGAPIKNMNSLEKKESLRKNISSKFNFSKKVNVLIIDDLYSSGSTVNILAKKLKEDQNVNEIRVLTMTKTKNGN